MKLKNKVALINSSSSQGIGRVIAERFAHEGIENGG